MIDLHTEKLGNPWTDERILKRHRHQSRMEENEIEWNVREHQDHHIFTLRKWTDKLKTNFIES